MEDTANMCPDEARTYGLTICLTHEFEKVRKYGSREKGLQAGDTETFSRRVYLHIYFNDVNRIKKDRALDEELSKLRDEYISGQRDFKPAAQKLMDKYMAIRDKRTSNPEIKFRTMTIRDIKPTVNITAKTTAAISYSLLTRNSDSI